MQIVDRRRRRPPKAALSRKDGRQGGVRAGLGASRRPDLRPRECATRKTRARGPWRLRSSPPEHALLIPAFRCQLAFARRRGAGAGVSPEGATEPRFRPFEPSPIFFAISRRWAE
jgi:hypothetical protein